MARRQEDWQTPKRKNKDKRSKRNFPIGNVNDYKCKLPSANCYEKRLAQIGDFSANSKNKFVNDSHQMKFLYIPKRKSQTESGWVFKDVHMDLKEGFRDFKDIYDNEETSFDKLLQWICLHKGEVENRFHPEELSKETSDSWDLSKGATSNGTTSKGALSKIDFICTRKVLESILSTIYKKGDISDENRERSGDWLLYATKFRDVIHLKKIETVEAKQIEKGRTGELKKIIYYGHKFEQNLQSDSPNSEPDTSRPVNVNEKYYAVLEAHLDGHGLIFSSETDAVDPNCNSASFERFVEIKTNFILNSPKRKKKFRSKLLSWYLQCFIAGVPRVICGFRNDDGIVEEMKVYSVSDLPGMAENTWSPNVCFNFGARFLSHMKERVVEDDPKIVYKFSWKHGEEVVRSTSEVLENPFLPDWYIREMTP